MDHQEHIITIGHRDLVAAHAAALFARRQPEYDIEYTPFPECLPIAVERPSSDDGNQSRRSLLARFREVADRVLGESDTD